MQHRDEFDDPDIAGAMSSIFRAMDQRDRVKPRKPLRSLVLVIGLGVFLASVLWYSWPREQAQQELMAVPIIRADAQGFKEVPDDPGGMDISHRDSTVFGTMRADGRADARIAGQGGIENLLSDREDPMARDQVFAGLKTDIKRADFKIEGRTVATYERQESAGQPQSGSEPVAVLEEPVTPAVKPQQAQMAAIRPSVTPPVTQTQGEDEQAAARFNNAEPAAGLEQAAKAPQTTIQEAGRHYVQFASLKSDEAARKAWSGLQKDYAMLKDVALRVQKADLGARGTFYRVQAGPVSEQSARAICASVEKKNPGGCLVIKP